MRRPGYFGAARNEAGGPDNFKFFPVSVTCVPSMFEPMRIRGARGRPERLHEETSADYTDMIYAEIAAGSRSVERRSCANGAFGTEPWPTAWRKRATAVRVHAPTAEPLEERSARPMPLNACKRSSSAGSKARRSYPRQRPRRCSSWALLAPSQIRMRKIDRWQSLAMPLANTPVALAA